MNHAVTFHVVYKYWYKHTHTSKSITVCINHTDAPSFYTEQLLTNLLPTGCCPTVICLRPLQSRRLPGPHNRCGSCGNAAGHRIVYGARVVHRMGVGHGSLGCHACLSV